MEQPNVYVSKKLILFSSSEHQIWGSKHQIWSSKVQIWGSKPQTPS